MKKQPTCKYRVHLYDRVYECSLTVWVDENGGRHSKECAWSNCYFKIEKGYKNLHPTTAAQTGIGV